MRIAVIYNDKDVFVEFNPDKFKKLLEEYTKNLKISEALDKIVEDLKKETLLK